LAAPTNESGTAREIIEATWIAKSGPDHVPNGAGPELDWPTNAGAFHVQFTTNFSPTMAWQALSGSLITNAGNFYQAVPQNIGGAGFFRLSTVAP
jgi:hypothetical protein